MHTPTKIGYLDFAMDPDKNIFGLDVSVYNVLLVEILQGSGHLSNVLTEANSAN